MAVWPFCGLLFEICEDFIYDAENLTQFIYAWQNIQFYKIFLNSIEAKYLVLIFCIPQVFKIDFESVQIIMVCKKFFTNNHSMPIKGQWEHSDFCLDTRAALFLVSICLKHCVEIENFFCCFCAFGHKQFTASKKESLKKPGIVFENMFTLKSF